MPSLTEIVYAVGAEEKLYGVTNYCNYPPQVSEKSKVGDLVAPHPEVLLSLEPDLVLLSSPTQAQLALDLANSGLRVALFPDPTDLDGVFAQIQAVADTMGYSARGAELVDSLRAELAAIQSDDSLSVYIEMSADPLMTIGNTSYLNDALAYIGLYNIFADKKQAYPVISAEQVISRSPQVILFLYPQTGQGPSRRLGWSELPAVKKKLVYDELPYDELLRPGPRLISGLKTLDSLIREAD